ncbi:MAG: DUF4834 family protein [Duncaniella sp.]|nr:DUF4834 family protein [Duncaniella sp.]
MITLISTILIVYVLWLVVRPLLAGYLRRRFQRKVEDMLRNAYGIPRDPDPRRQGNSRGNSAPGGRRRKIFAADEGEYIEFQETVIEVTAETSGSTPSGDFSHTPAEPRVSDAEWEEI